MSISNAQNFKELKDSNASSHKKLDDLEDSIDKLNYAVFGIDEGNGLRGQVKEHHDFIEKFLKPHLKKLELLDEISKNLWRIFWVILTTSVLALGSRFVQINFSDKTAKTAESTAQTANQNASTANKNAKENSEQNAEILKQLRNN